MSLEMSWQATSVATDVAGVLGLEPRIKVLETFVIPFHYTPVRRHTNKFCENNQSSSHGIFLEYALHIDGTSAKVQCVASTSRICSVALGTVPK